MLIRHTPEGVTTGEALDSEALIDSVEPYRATRGFFDAVPPACNDTRDGGLSRLDAVVLEKLLNDARVREILLMELEDAGARRRQ